MFTYFSSASYRSVFTISGLMPPDSQNEFKSDKGKCGFSMSTQNIQLTHLTPQYHEDWVTNIDLWAQNNIVKNIKSFGEL